MEMLQYTDISKETLEQLSIGAFLTVQSETLINTMTISWGMIGYIWTKPIFHVLVRQSRYTKELIEGTDTFTVSIPSKENPMKEALAFCGTKSGRDVNKISACNLKLQKGQIVNTPIIADATTHFECRIVAKTDLKEELLDPKYKKSFYGNGDLHTIYYGEIVACYQTKA